MTKRTTDKTMSFTRRMNVLSSLLAVGAIPEFIGCRVIGPDETSRERRKRKASAEKKKARKNVKASRNKNRGK